MKVYQIDILRAGGCLKLFVTSHGPPADFWCATAQTSCCGSDVIRAARLERGVFDPQSSLKGLSEFSGKAKIKSLQRCNSNVQSSSRLPAGFISRLIRVSCFSTFPPGTKLQWSSAITLAVFVWLFTAFWSAMPLIGWGEYDYEPLRTCCTLDYSKGDRWALARSHPAG